VPLSHGPDDRKEYFELTDSSLRSRVANSVVALIPKRNLEGNSEPKVRAPTWAEVAGLCPSEPFSAQPSAALCSGVLVDWDLILTASHCVRALPLSELAVVFGYFYEDPESLAFGAGDTHEVLEIVAGGAGWAESRAAPGLRFVALEAPRGRSTRTGPGSLRPVVHRAGADRRRQRDTNDTARGAKARHHRRSARSVLASEHSHWHLLPLRSRSEPKCRVAVLMQAACLRFQKSRLVRLPPAACHENWA
jgi:hypothetical protein